MREKSEKTRGRDKHKKAGGDGVRERGCGKEQHERKDESVR